MAVKFTNNAVTTLSASISAGVTQFSVASNSGFPSLSGADHTYVTIDNEVVKVTAISGTTFTCIATSSSHANGDNVELRMTAELLDDFATDLEAMPKTGGTFTGAIAMSNNAITGVKTPVATTDAVTKAYSDLNLLKTGGTVTGNVSLNDNVVLGLGNDSSSGSDLILYHDGTNAHINTSTGALRLSSATAGSSVQILGSGETLAEFTDDGDVDLFHNGVLKFSTTATGINVVGNLVLSGTVDGVDIQSLNSAVTLNTAKTGITSSQTNAILANSSKVGITSAQASAITANTSKTTNATHTGDVTGATALTIGTSKVLTAMIADDAVTADKLANSINTAIATNTAKTGITSAQTSAITANTAKTGITSSQATAISNNTAKTGITSGQASAITANTAKTGITSGQTSAITANTAKVGITSAQASAITANTAKVTNSTSASDLSSGTLPMARLSGTLPALNGSNLTNLPAGSDSTKLPLAGGTMTGALVTDTLVSMTGSSSGTSKVFTVASDASENYIYVGSSATKWRKQDDSANLMEITSSGNLSFTGTLTATNAGQTKLYKPTNSGNPEFYLGASDTNRMGIQTVFNGGTQVLNRAHFFTQTTSSSADAGYMTFSIDDGSERFRIDDGGVNVTGAIAVTGTVDGVDIATRDAVLTSTTTTAGNALPKSGGTMTGELKLADNVNLAIGSSSGGDLQIYHNASDSYIDEAGTGNLFIKANSAINFRRSNDNSTMATFNGGGSVDLYYNNGRKLKTRDTGVTVQGNNMQFTSITEIGNVNHEAGGGFSHLGNSTTASRKARLWLDADGGNFSGSDYYYIEKIGGSGVAHILQNAGDMTFATNGSTRLTIGSGGGITTSGNLTVGGTLTATLATNSISTSQIYDNAISSAKIASGAVTGVKLSSSMGDCSAKGFTSVGYDSGDYLYWSNNSHTGFLVNGGERLRITTLGLTVSGSGSSAEIRMQDSAGNIDGYVYAESGSVGFLDDDGNWGYKMATDSMHNWYINAGEEMRLESDGDLHVDGNVIAYSSTISDERLKHDIEPITDALSKVNQLNGVTFTYNADDKKSAGLIAQDVEKVLPSAVTESTLPLKVDDGNEYKVLQYDQTIGLLVEAIKELTAKVEALENK